MNLLVPPGGRPDPLYPDSDGQPMAENTLQFEWIVTIKENLELLFLDQPDVFVAGDLLWYAVEGDPTIRLAPDAMVAFGRPKGRRGSYRQWEEGGVAPHVVFEVLSPGNRAGEMRDKRTFYEKYGVEEYYIYDPDEITLEGWLRDGEALKLVPEMDTWVSPRLQVRFVLESDTLRLFRPDGAPFLTFVELDEKRRIAEQRAEEADDRAEKADQRAEKADQRAKKAEQQAEEDRRNAERARQQAEVAERRADEARKQTERLKAQLRALGIDPDA
jgi:Uma2 family endonuclease